MPNDESDNPAPAPSRSASRTPAAGLKGTMADERSFGPSEKSGSPEDAGAGYIPGAQAIGEPNHATNRVTADDIESQIRFAVSQIDGRHPNEMMSHYWGAVSGSSFFAKQDQLVKEVVAFAYPLRLAWGVFPQETYELLREQWGATRGNTPLPKNKPGLVIIKVGLLPENANENKRVSEYGILLDYAFSQLIPLDRLPAWLDEKPLNKRVDEARAFNPRRRRATKMQTAQPEVSAPKIGAGEDQLISTSHADAATGEPPDDPAPTEQGHHSPPVLQPNSDVDRVETRGNKASPTCISIPLSNHRLNKLAELVKYKAMRTRLVVLEIGCGTLNLRHIDLHDIHIDSLSFESLTRLIAQEVNKHQKRT